MPFTWDDEVSAGFANETHRGRYLKCSALINAPPPESPLYAMHYVGRSPVYATSADSMVLLATEEAYYPAKMSEFELVVGRWDKSYKPSGPDPDSRLNQASFMWADPRNKSDVEKRQSMSKFKVDSVSALYDAIVQRCCPSGGIAATFISGAELRSAVPRPLNPEQGVHLGTTLCGRDVTTSAGPQRYKGVERARKKRKSDDARVPLDEEGNQGGSGELMGGDENQGEE